MQITLNNIVNAINALNSNKAQFASVLSTTNVAIAAKHKKDVVITKTTKQTVQLFATQNAYTNAIKTSASKIASNNAANVQNFTKSATWFTHLTNCYAIVTHSKTNVPYLYIRNIKTQNVTYYINNVIATKQQVAAYLTPANANKLLQDSNKTIYNKTNNVEHNVVMRTITLSNVDAITVNKTTLVK